MGETGLKLKSILQLFLGILLIGLLVGCGTSSESQELNDAKNLKAGTMRDSAPKYELLSLLNEGDGSEIEKDNHEENQENSIEKEEIIEEEIPNKKTSSTEARNDSTPTIKNDSKPKQSKKEISSEPKVSDASGTYYVTVSSLNVRSGDGTSYGILGSIAEDKTVKVTGKTSNGWYQFDFNGKKGYVSGSYLTTTKPSTNTASISSEPKTENKDETKSEQASNGNVVDKMTNLGNSQQVILVTTNGSSTSRGQVRTYEKDSNGKWNEVLNATAYIGKNGFASNKVEGDGKSPTGKYSIGTAFGYQGNPGTKLNFKNSTSNDVWVDDSNSKYYNTWQKNDMNDKDWTSAEDMTHRLYNYGFVINYNTNQTPGKGSAIFMHVGNSYTLGCTAMSQSNLISVMKWLDPAKKPVVIQTPESGLSNY